MRPVSDLARRRPKLVVALLVFAVGVVPLGVSVIALRSPSWYPSLDWALIELRVRDVGWSDPPLLGSPGRFQAFGQLGAHPGPLFFYLLAPMYRLFGSSPTSLMISTSALGVGAIASALWIAHRRGGTTMVLSVGAAMALLVHALGGARLAVPWNPWLTVPWWFVFLLAAWSVLCDDLPMLPVAVFAGSICAQTHVSYLGMIVVVGALLGGWVAVGLRRRRIDRAGAIRWLASSVGMLLVLSIPVLVQQLTGDPANLAVLRASVVSPVEPTVGLGSAIDASASLLDPFSLVRGTDRLDGALSPGLLLLWAWLVAAALSVRLAHRHLLRLHVIVGVVVVLGYVSTSRVAGKLFPYLVLWWWGTATLVLLATSLSFAMLAVARGAPARHRQIALGVVAALITGATVTTVVDVASAAPPFPGVSYAMDRMSSDLEHELDRSVSYTVAAEDPFAALAGTFALLLQLERAGFDVSLPPTFEVSIGTHRARVETETGARITFVAGTALIDRWRTRRGAEEVAHAEPRDGDTERAEAMKVEIGIALVEADLLDLLPLLAQDLFHLATHPSMPDDIRPMVEDLIDLSVPTSVFVETIDV
jgi:hypothetical protein